MPLSPQRYIQRLKTALNNSQNVQTWTIVDENILGDRGHFRVRFLLTNSDFVEASEFFLVRAEGTEPNEQTIRIILLRKALPYERKRYEQYLRDELGES